MTYPPDRRSVQRALDGLALFRDVFDDQIGRTVRAIAEEPTKPNAARLVALLLEETELYPEELVGDAWQNHLLDRLLAVENAFSRKAERVPYEELGEGLITQVRRELALLQQLYLSGAAVAAEVYGALGDVTAPGWRGLRPLGLGPALHPPEAVALKRALAESTDWASMAKELAATYSSAGVGVFGRFHAFRWAHGERGAGHLEGVSHPDPVRLSDLVGYEHEREPIVLNAERFAAGWPGNNALLYGERGTGKSSTVKALVNEFGDRGLRLIEVPKEHLDDFHELLAPLRDRRERFILYVDDLSFEEQETHYKALKAILEGGVEARPDNVILYATSNRRHLVRERFVDRQAVTSDDDDVHMRDTLEEKLSLSDRFGLHVTFGAPDQERYLAIVGSLAAKRGIELPSETLRRRALSWAQRQNGRSGRTARQFVDALVAELGTQNRRAAEVAAPSVVAAPTPGPAAPPLPPAPPSPTGNTGEDDSPWRRRAQ